MTALEKQEGVSSAEITAVYRCAVPELSQDKLSEKLSSAAGRQRAAAFITKYNYPLVSRKISVCAGYFLSEATRLIASGKYDSCISFASGFSLLLYNIAVKNLAYNNIQYLDTDLPHMIEERERRINTISHTLDQQVIKNIYTKAFDIEKAYQKNQRLKDIFPNYHKPIFIADGVSYFLSSGCVDWLIEQMGSYTQSATMLYYWPENMPHISSLFARVFSDLNKGMILETLKSFWDQSTIAKFRSQFSHTADYSLKEAEQILAWEKTPVLESLLTDPNQYFPVRLITGEK
ncbi:MAG: hypothetical protein K0R14_244 [Burkholderiales bacterium]|jgi:hypothetical protein|nr:hypothetical protein [Burkholderiales bacterium]